DARVAVLERRLLEASTALGAAQVQARAWRAAAEGGPNSAAMATAAAAAMGKDDRLQGSVGGAAAGSVQAGGGSGGGREAAAAAEEARHLKKEVSRLTAELARAEEARRLLEAEVLTLQERLRQPSTPSEIQFRSLSAAVEAIERRAKERERELETMVAAQDGRLELLRLQALHEEELRAKDETILRFRAELDTLL
ncbi:unnamed protein product, partial [Phaeothamnion confervicola]